jgi:CHAT domain-containing protein
MRSIVFWRHPTETILAALVCATPGLLPAATCGPDPPPKNAIGVAFQRACDEREKGHYEQAIRSFAEAARRAHEIRDILWETRSRVYVGGCQLRLFRYQAALESTESAATLADQAGLKQIAGGAEVNAALIYGQLGNFALARQKLTQAIIGLTGSNRPELLAQAYLLLSYLEMRLGDLNAGIRDSDLCIKAARQAERSDLEAMAWDFRGSALLKANRTKEAEDCLATAVRLYQTSKSKQVAALTLSHLAELKWAQKQNEAALGYIDQAFKNADPLFKSSPQYYPLNVRGGILRDLGRTGEAISAYREAVHSANVWRRSALPGDTTNIETVKQLNNTYQSFAELTADQSLRRHDDGLAREALEALAQNRAASLREQLALEMGNNHALPADYLAELGELQSLQARVTLADDAASRARLTDLEITIGELETKIGLDIGKNSSPLEKNPTRNSLRDIQSGLGATEALLSFCLGEKQSFLWAITGETMNLYRLPAATEIGKQAEALRNALERRENFARPARTLSDALFSQLDIKVWQKPDWLIVGDGPLLDRVPFAVLPASAPSQAGTLMKTHAVRLLPSELLMLARTPKATNMRFLGVADPLYNLADSRGHQRPVLLNTATARGSSALGRLPGSQREIRTAARSSGMAQTELLVGPDANLASFTAALSQHPAIIHFAVHVVSPPGHPEQAALALSLGNDNIPELLTREKIASLRVPGSLIVLSGCSSGQGQPAPSAGLIGLSRAWLLAGASAVIVSNWPTPDDSGQFFTSFYSHLTNTGSGSLAKRAASALQQAQLQMQQRGGYGSVPAFWAAYSIVSKE